MQCLICNIANYLCDKVQRLSLNVKRDGRRWSRKGEEDEADGRKGKGGKNRMERRGKESKCTENPYEDGEEEDD